MPFSVREGINVFLAGFVPTENLRFRDEELSFKITSNTGKKSIFISLVITLAVRISTITKVICNFLVF